MEYTCFLNRLYLRLTGRRLSEAERDAVRRRRRDRGLTRFRTCAWRVLRQVQAQRRGDTPDQADLWQIKQSPQIAELVGAFTHVPQNAWKKYRDPKYKFEVSAALHCTAPPAIAASASAHSACV